jgi:chemotaxis protein histidine kinase CheA
MMFTLKFDEVKAQWTPVVIHAQLKMKGGQAPSMIDRQYPITVEDDKKGGIGGLEKGVIQILDKKLLSDNMTVEITVGPGNPDPAILKKQMSFALKVTAKPYLGPTPGLTIPLGHMLPPISGAVLVTLDTPAPRIKIIPETVPIVIDSLNCNPMEVKAALQMFNPATGTLEMIRNASPKFQWSFIEGEDAVEPFKEEVRESGITTLRMKMKRTVVGIGAPINLVDLTISPPPGTDAATRYYDGGGKDRKVLVRTTTHKVSCKFTVHRVTDTGHRVVYLVRTEEVTGEVVNVRFTGGGEKMDWNGLYLSLEVVNPPGLFEKSHHTHVMDIPVNAQAKTAGPIDLRTEKDELTTECNVTLEMPKKDEVGLWLFSAGKLGWATTEVVQLTNYGVSEEDLKVLITEGGTLAVGVEGVLNAPGVDIRRAIVDAAGELTVTEGQTVTVNSYDSDKKILLFKIITTADLCGPKRVDVKKPVAMQLDRDVQAALLDILKEAPLVDPSLQSAAKTFVEESFNFLADKTMKELEDLWIPFFRRVLLVRDFVKQTRDIRDAEEIALDLREKVILRQIDNLVNGLIEIASWKLSNSKWWNSSKEAAEATLKEASEGGIKAFMKTGEKEIEEKLVATEARIEAWYKTRKALSARQAELSGQFSSYLRMSPEQRRLARDRFKGIASELKEADEQWKKFVHGTVGQLNLDESERAYLKSRLKEFKELADASGETFDKLLKTTLDEMKKYDELKAARIANLKKEVTSLVGREFEERVAELTASLESCNNRLNELRFSLSQYEHGITIYIKDDAGASALRAEIEDFRHFSETLEKQINLMKNPILPDQAKWELGLEEVKLQFGNALADKAKEAREAKKVYDERIAVAQPYEYYDQQNSYFGWLWWICDNVVVGAKVIAGWVFSWGPLAYLAEGLAYIGKQLIGYLTRFLSWLTETIESLSPTVSQLDSERFARGYQKAQEIALSPRFMDLMKEDRKAVKETADRLNPDKTNGTFGRDEADAVKAKSSEAPKKTAQDIVREQKELVRRYLTVSVENALDKNRLSEPLHEDAVKRFAHCVQETRRVISTVNQYSRGIELPNEGFFAWFKGVADNVCGESITWQDADNAVEWIGFCLGWFLRIAAGLGIATGIGIGVGAAAMGLAEISDRVTAGFRVVIASLGTLRGVNGIGGDLVVLEALSYEAAFEKT